MDTGATNRKLGSDMGDSVTGGGLHGKDLSKADVSVNIWAWLKAQEMDMPVEVCCAIGDEAIGSVSFEEMVETYHASTPVVLHWSLQDRSIATDTRRCIQKRYGLLRAEATAVRGRKPGSSTLRHTRCAWSA